MQEGFRRDYLVRLPLPLAQLYDRAYNEGDIRSQHENAFYLCEALIKLMAAPLIAAYLHEVRQGNQRVASLDQRLLQLTRPALGEWLGMVRELARYMGERPEVWFLNQSRHGRQVEYLSYATGQPVRHDTMAPELLDLLSLVKGQTVTEEELATLAAQREANEARQGAPAPPSAPASAHTPGTLRVALLYKRSAQPDEEVLHWLEAQLTAQGYQVFIDRHLSLRRILVLLVDPVLRRAVEDVLQSRPCPEQRSFDRLHSAGVLAGHTPREARLRCQLYAAYLRRHLLEDR